MGAEISSDREYDAYRDDQFAQKYRERYGENTTAEDLLEQVRMEKLKIDQERRYQERQKSLENDRSKSDDEYYRKRQEDNYRIMKRTYDRQSNNYRDRRDSDRRHTRRSRRRDDDYRRRRSRYSSRDRDRSRRSWSESSAEKENRSRSRRETSRKSRSDSRSTVDGKRSRSKSPRRSKEGSKRRSRSEDRRSRSSRREKEDSSPEIEKRKSKKSSSGVKKSSGSNKESKGSVEKAKKRSKKKKKKKIQEHQSAPDLTAIDRQYGRGPWQRIHEYFDKYEHGPQSWVAELSRDRAATLPGPVIERQIVYGLPATLPRPVDGLGYPLKERNPGFQPVPYQTYLMQKPTRQEAIEMLSNTLQSQPQQYALTPSPNTQRSAAFQSPNVSHIHPPAGAVPSVGPQKSSRVSSQHPPQTENAVYATVKKPVKSAGPPEVIIPERGYEVQARLPPNKQETPLLKAARTASENSSIPPTYRTPPTYGTSGVSEKSVTPTPKPRTKTTPKETASKRERSKKKSGSKTQQRTSRKEDRGTSSKITAKTAREDFESLLAADYEMVKVKRGAGYTEEFPPVFPSTYRANQEIFVDDVIFRQQPKITELSDTDSSDMMTDEEHIITLGENLSPMSAGYSSGYDLEIPEGFLFDVKETKNRKTQTATPKSAVLLETAQKKRDMAEGKKSKKSSSKSERNHKERNPIPQTRGTQTKKPQSELKHQTVILTNIEPVTRMPRKSSSPERKSPRQKTRHESPKRKSPPSHKTRKSRTESPERKSPPSRKSREKSTHSSPERPVNVQVAQPVQSSYQHQDGGKRSKKKPHDHPVAPMEDIKRKRNQRIQHPPKDNSYIRVIYPSHKWESKPEPKKTHDVGVGTKPPNRQKSIGIQTPKPKEPAKAIYFLKPISAQEVFIDDSTVASQSESNLSNVRSSSMVSNESTLAKSDTSWTKSSTYSSGADLTDPSESESIPQNFTRNSHLYSSNHRHKAPTISSIDTADMDSEPNGRLGPSSMVLGESESIQASSFSARDGKVFCITRSRCGSSPPTTLSRHPKTKHHSGGSGRKERESPDHRQIEPSIDSEILTKTAAHHEEHSPPQHRHRNDHEPVDHVPYREDDVMYFNPTEVGKWVLDCYINDHKLTTQEQHWLNENLAKLGPEERQIIVEHARKRRNERRASPHMQEPRRAEPIEAENFFNAPPPPAPPNSSMPLQHEDRPPRQERALDSGTEASIDIASDVGVFQKELIKAKHKIWKKMHQRDKSPEPAKLVEQYKNQLKQWNNSPTSNVVLAECCAVTDTDSFQKVVPSEGPKKRDSPQNPTREPLMMSRQQGSQDYYESDRERGYLSKTDSQVTSTSSFEMPLMGYSKRETLPSNAPLQPPLQEGAKGPLEDPRPLHDPTILKHPGKTGQDFSKEKSMQSIDQFLEDLSHSQAAGGSSRGSQVGKRGRQPSPLEDWRVVSPGPTKVPVKKFDLPPAVQARDRDVNDNHAKMKMFSTKDDNKMRRSMDSLLNSRERKVEDIKLHPAKNRSASVTQRIPKDDSSPPPSPAANPFSKMDQEELSPYFRDFKRPNPKPDDSEKELIESLERARQRSKQESLEERTARILGIHRKIPSSSISDQEEVENPQKKKMSALEEKKEDKKKDLNTYMNNLLTGATEVSPATKQRFFEKNKENMNGHVTSPLAAPPSQSSRTNGSNGAKGPGFASPAPSSEKGLDEKNFKNEGEKSDSEFSDDEVDGSNTVTESFSVNVSDSLLEADIICTVKGRDAHQAPPTEYKIPEDVDKKTGADAGPTSPRQSGNIMTNYTRNIYADTPGFHRSEPSFDTTEDEDTDMDPGSLNASMDSRGGARFLEQRGTPPVPRVQDSPVPVASNSAPLTQKEIDIVRELYDRSSSRSHSVESAEDHKQHPQLIPLHDADEYDIKILDADQRRDSHDKDPDANLDVPRHNGPVTNGTDRRPSLQHVGKLANVQSEEGGWTNEVMSSGAKNGQDLNEEKGSSHGSHKGVTNVMESLGLDPSDAWVLSV